MHQASRAIAPAIFAGLLLLYLSTLTSVHTFDALSYVTSVERKPWQELFHPHHLAYGPLGALTLALADAIGYDGGAARPLQIVNALAGALGAALFYTSVLRGVGQRGPALVAALLLGLSYAFWYYAVEIEVYTVAALFLVICLRIMLADGGWTPRRLLWLGVALGGAVLFHQKNVLLCIPLLWCAIADLRSAGAPAAWLRRWSVYGMALVLSVGLPYLFAGLVVSGFRTPAEFGAWLTEYARTGWWGGPIGSDKLADLAQGLSETLAQPAGSLLWLVLGIAVAGGLRQGAAGRRLPYAVLLSWLVAYGGFFFWWEPDNIEFWIGILPPALLLLAQGLRSGNGRPWPLALAGGVVLAVGVINYGSITQRGDATRDLQRVIAAALAERSTPADLLIVPDGLLELYLPYYEQREQVLSLNQAIFDSGRDWDAACVLVRHRIETALHAGATAIIAAEAMQPPPDVIARHQVAQPQIDACFAAYRTWLLPLELPPQVPVYRVLPKANQLADGIGWRFDAAALGWRSTNVHAEQYNGGWVMVPDSDPALISPLLDLEAADYQALEIRMANQTSTRDAQLFYAGPDGAIDEAHSLRWELEPTDAIVTYTLRLADAPGWQGRISRLRIDPVGVGDGGQLVIESVRLVK